LLRVDGASLVCLAADHAPSDVDRPLSKAVHAKTVGYSSSLSARRVGANVAIIAAGSAGAVVFD